MGMTDMGCTSAAAGMSGGAMAAAGTSGGGRAVVRVKPEMPFEPQPGDDRVVCRCEEVTQGEIRQALHGGLRTLGEAKRFTRCGMGLCQGQTCERTVASLVSRELGIAAEDAGRITGRAPMRPVAMQELARCDAPEETASGKEAVSDGKH